MSQAVRVGVEVGGTFTDLVAFEAGGVRITKVPSTPQEPHRGAIAALDQSGLALEATGDLVHGSTVGHQRGARAQGAPKVAFFATEGFRDLLALQRQSRRSIYDIHYQKPEPVVPRRDTFEIPERVGPHGEVVTALDEGAARQRIHQALHGAGYESVAICFLNSYANPTHERRVAAMVAECFPDVGITCSCDVTREFREYERASTTVLAAYVQPVIDRYLGEFAARAGRPGLQGPLQPHAVQRGQVARARHGRQRDHLALLRPGGRRDGRDPTGRALGLSRPHHVRHGGHEHRRVPGAGWNTGADERRRDRRSAHSYSSARHRDGGGGRRLDRLARRPAACCGSVRARPAPSPARPATGAAAPTPQSPTRTSCAAPCSPTPSSAGAWTSIPNLPEAPSPCWRNSSAEAWSNSPTTRYGWPNTTSCGRSSSSRPSGAAIRVTMCSFPSAARGRCTRRGSPRYWVSRPSPFRPKAGVLSAFGLVASDFVRYENRTVRIALDEAGAAERVRAQFAAMRADADAAFAELGLTSALRHTHTLEMRYVGQAFEVPIPLSEDEIARLDAGLLRERFNEAHHRIFEFDDSRTNRPEIVSFRLGIASPPPAVPALVGTDDSPHAADVTLFDGGERRKARRLNRGALLDVGVSEGPLLIADETSTAYVPPGWRARVDTHP